MSNESIATTLWGAPEQTSSDDTILGTGKAPEPPKEAPQAVPEAIEQPDAVANALYGMSDAQVPEGGAYPEVRDLYDSLERVERLDGEEVDADAYKASSSALQAFATEAGMGRAHVSTLMTAAKAAMDYPITSPEALQARNERCLSELRAAWGKDFDKNMAFAKAEADRLSRSVPYAYQVLNMGAGSDPALVKVLAEAGRARRK